MRILVTNDDGVHADGIFALSDALRMHHDVTVVAPERQQSAAGHAITLHKPLRLNPVSLRDGSTAYGSNGTPADCASLGALIVLDGQVDLVVSGINRGPNLGWDVHYSGTVSAAIEAAIIGIPSFAISVTSWAEDIDWTGAQRVACATVRWLEQHPLPAHTILNVNVPDCSAEGLRGVCITTQGRRQYIDRIETRTDPTGRNYYWLGGSIAGDPSQAEIGTDVRANAEGYVSVTPIQLDMTAYQTMPDLQEFTI